MMTDYKVDNREQDSMVSIIKQNARTPVFQKKVFQIGTQLAVVAILVSVLVR